MNQVIDFEDSVDKDLSRYTHEAFVDMWTSFLENYVKEGEDSYFYIKQIKQMALENNLLFILDFQDLVYAIELKGQMEFDDAFGKKAKFEDFQILRMLVLRQADEAISSLFGALSRIMMMKTQDFFQANAVKIRVGFSNIDIDKEFTEIGPEDIGRFVRIEGIVADYDDKHYPKTHKRVWKCPEGHTFELPPKAVPKECGYCGVKGGLVYDEQKTKKFQENCIKFKIQQTPSKTPVAKTSGEESIECLGESRIKFVYDSIFFGNYVSIVGIVRSDTNMLQNRGSLKESAYDRTYVEASYIEVKPESALSEYDPALEEIVKKAVNPKTEAQDWDKLVRSVAPTIWVAPGDFLKEAVLLTCLSSHEKFDKGNRVRGSVFGIMIADPSTAKTMILKWALKVMNRAFYSSGDRTSAVGFTGGIKFSKDDDKAKMTTGLFEMANNGLLEMDEFEKRKEQDFNSLNEPMSDDQTVTVTKAGARKYREINTSVLAAANPSTPSSRYDVSKNLFEQTVITPTILDRFDWIGILRDIPDEELDRHKLDTILASESRSVTREEFDKIKMERKVSTEDFYPIPFIKQYIQYARTYNPRFAKSPEAIAILHEFYRKYRKMNIRIPKTKRERDNWSEEMEIPAISLRKARSFIRLTEARARGCLRDHVTKEDALVVQRIMEATLSAMGFNPTLNNSYQKYSNMDYLNDLIQKAKTPYERFVITSVRTFQESMDRLSWQRCEDVDCKGTGYYYQFGGKNTPCQSCRGEGGIKRPFAQSELRKQMQVKYGMTDKMFYELWNKMEHNTHEIERSEEQLPDGEPLYLDRTPHYQKNKKIDAAKYDVTLDPGAEFPDQDNVNEGRDLSLKESIMRRSPHLAERLRRIDVPGDV